MTKSTRTALLLGLAALAVITVVGGGCLALRQTAVKIFPQSYRPQGEPLDLTATFTGKDEQRTQLKVKLAVVATGLAQPTSAEFVPGEPDTVVVLQKEGALRRVSLPKGEVHEVVKLEVNTASEQGLLGLAFHPGFAQNRRFFLHFTTPSEGKELSRIEEWKAATPFTAAAPTRVRVVLDLEQPYANHNGGHLAFGPDGMLYVGFGDGGFRADPHGNGQKLDTLLGKMLRLDVDATDKGYAVPRDNPLVKNAGARPEIWAYGLRNPWRYTFDPKGRLIAADVGQDAYEEVGFVAAGDNAGWVMREGRHCFQPKEGCPTEGLREPFVEYGRDDGTSVTGGVVASGDGVPALKGRYVFGDFVSGRLWAVDLPESAELQPKQSELAALGKWPILPSHFFNDPGGNVWFLDFSGRMMRLVVEAPPAR
jgi:glucose/arabinose dehydrogenase